MFPGIKVSHSLTPYVSLNTKGVLSLSRSSGGLIIDDVIRSPPQKIDIDFEIRWINPMRGSINLLMLFDDMWTLDIFVAVNC